MYPHQAAENGAVLNMNVAGKTCGVSDNHLVANLTVMGHMGIGHQKIIIAEHRSAAAAGRSPVDGDTLAEGIVIADNDLGAVIFEFQILGNCPHRAKLK